MRVVVAGWVGSTNVGDELVLWALLRKLADRSATVIAISTDHDATRRLHGVEAIDHRRLDLVDLAIGSADAVIFGGGGLLQDETSRFNLPYHLSRVAIARRHRVPVGIVGLGVGPLGTPLGRSLVRRNLDGTVLGAVRDRASADLLADLGLQRPQLAADLALSLRSPEVETTDRIAVCLRPWHGGGTLPVSRSWDKGLENDWFPEAMARALDEVAGRTGLGIHLVAFQAGRDDRMNDLVAERMRSTPTTAVPGFQEALDEVASCQLTVTLRYHGAIAATLGSRPSVLVGYSSKVDSLAADLGPACRGLGWSPDAVATIPGAVDDVLGRDEQALDALRRLRVRELGNDDAIDRLLTAAIGI